MSYETLFGLPSLDACIRTTTRNHLVFVIGPSGGGKSVLLRNAIATHLRSGRGAIAVLLDESPDDFIDSLSTLIPREQLISYLSNKYLKIVDAFTFRSAERGVIHKRSDFNVRYSNSTNPMDLLDNIKICLEENKTRNLETIVTIDSLNEIYTSSDPVRTAEFIKYVKALLTRSYNTLVLATIHADSDNISGWLKDYMYVADGIVLLDIGTDQKGRFFRYFQVKRFRASDHCREPIIYKLESGRILS